MESKYLKVRIKEDWYDPNNTREYKKGEYIKVEENIYGDSYHVWVGNRLDLIRKSFCTIMGRLN